MVQRIALVLSCLASMAFRAQDSRESRPADPIEAALQASRTTADENRWRAIPWRESLTDTLAEAKKNEQQVFLFGADGDLWSANC
jgi:hypothetical protein